MNTTPVANVCYFNTVSEAAAELARRRAAGLHLDVEAWWENELKCGRPPLPESGMENGAAIMGRHVATFRYEDGCAVLMAQQGNLPVLWAEYVADEFVTASPGKVSLMQGHICHGRGRSGGLKLDRHEALAPVGRGQKPQMHPGNFNRQPLQDIRTPNGELLVDVHRAHQRRLYPEALQTDLSPWLKGMGKSQQYYEAYIGMMLAHGVLLEDYHGGESGEQLGGFTQTVFEPAWRRVFERFGIRPLIVRLPWRREFAYYPADEGWREHGILDEWLPAMAAAAK
jgi:hypothetical protein